MERRNGLLWVELGTLEARFLSLSFRLSPWEVFLLLIESEEEERQK